MMENRAKKLSNWRCKLSRCGTAFENHFLVFLL